MNAILALLLLGQVGGETSISDSFRSQFSSQPPATVEPVTEESPPLPKLEPTPAARSSSVGILVADSPATRARATNAIANGATQRAAIQPSVPAASQETVYASQLLENLLSLDEQNQSKVRKVKLVEVVSRSMDAQTQAVAIGAYWDLAVHIGRLRFAQDKISVLTSLGTPNDGVDRAVLEAALANAEANEAAAQDELLTAQYHLVRTAAISWNDTLPWPSDMPLVGAYRTNYEAFFAQRAAPLEIRHIHESLPGKLRLIERCAASISTAEQATSVLVQNYKQGRAPIASVLESADRWERAQHTFLSAVLDYNDRIAEYSLAAVGPSVGPETLVTTLIKTPNAAANVANNPNNVRQANVESGPVEFSGGRPFSR